MKECLFFCILILSVVLQAEPAASVHVPASLLLKETQNASDVALRKLQSIDASHPSWAWACDWISLSANITLAQGTQAQARGHDLPPGESAGSRSTPETATETETARGAGAGAGAGTGQTSGGDVDLHAHAKPAVSRHGVHAPASASASAASAFAPAQLGSHLPAYWINLVNNTDRRQYMSGLLDTLGHRLGIGVHRRVSAVWPGAPTYRLTQLEKPCRRNTDGDIAIILSHLTAMHTAVYDTSPQAQRSDYALIFEDDIHFNLLVDIRKILAIAPRNFGVLQLSTTNTEALSKLWETFVGSRGSSFWTKNDWKATTANGKYTLYWGALGYVINKKVVRSFVDDVVTVGSDGELSFKIVNSFFPEKCVRTRLRPCVLANCLFSDSYIYSGAGPTYVSHFPILSSGRSVGLNSTVHQTHVPAHVEAFVVMEKLLVSLRSLPRHRRCRSKALQRTAVSAAAAAVA